MNGFAILFLMLNAAALLGVSRRWAPLPLLVGACYMTLGQGIQVGPFHFPVIRLLLLAGFVRVLVRRERLAGGLNSLDWVILAWGAAIASIFLIADTIAADVANRRADRMAARQLDPARAGRGYGGQRR